MKQTGKANILLCVTGSIAAYKAADLASKLTAGDFSVKTAMTPNARQLVAPKTFEALTNNPVYTDLWTDNTDYKVEHINLVDWADVIVVAPATANIIGKAANGIYDDLVSSLLCACWKKTTIFVPAMNVNMWANPVVTQNVKKLDEAGYKVVDPANGRLACGTSGTGRMPEPATIVEMLKEISANLKKK